MKARFFLTAALALAIAGALSGCSVQAGKYFKYDHARMYSAGNGSAQGIEKLEIDWTAGEVLITVSESASEVSFTESVQSGEDDLKLHSKTEGKELNIRFAASGASLPDGFSKDLKVTLPVGVLREIDVESISADVKIEGVRANSVSAETVSGEALFDSCEISDLSVESVSGDMELLDTSFYEGEFDSVSGNVELSLSDTGFRGEFQTVSGNLFDEFGAQKSGKTLLYKDGKLSFDVETVSGDLILRKASAASEGSNPENPNPENPNPETPNPENPSGEKRYQTYERSDRYLSGGAALSGVVSIEIEWAEGDVEILSSDSEKELRFFETASEENAPSLCYLFERGELKIEYAPSGARYSNSLSKTLNIVIPKGAQLFEIEAEGLSEISIRGISSRELSLSAKEELSIDSCNFSDGEFTSALGGITLKDSRFSEAEFETSSGEVSLFLSFGFRLEFETRSGSLIDEFACERRGTFYFYGDGSARISVETISGDLSLHKA